MGGAARTATATNQDLSLSHVIRMDAASVWRVWLETNVTDVIIVITVSTAMAAQVGWSSGKTSLRSH